MSAAPTAALRRGHASPLAGQGARFLVVGTFNTGFGYALFSALVLWADLHYTVVLLISHAVSVIVAYVLYRTLVYRVHGRVLRDFPRFYSVYLVAIGLNLVLLPVLVDVVGLPVLLAQGLVVVVTALQSFFGHRHFSFRRSTSTTREVR